MDRQINHKTMRVMVGVIAIALAPVVHLLAGSDFTLTSISISYWTNSQDIFVGSLVAIAFFLLAYNGTGGERDWEFYLSKASCLFAVIVALFPTKGFSDGDIPPIWVSAVSSVFGLEPLSIHYGAAILLFTCLIAMMWFFSNRAMKKGKPTRAYIYRTISASMVVGIVAIFIVGRILEHPKTILAIEVWGLTLFGIGWLIAGTYKNESVSA